MTKPLTGVLGLLAAMTLGACGKEPPKPLGNTPLDNPPHATQKEGSAGIRVARVAKAGPEILADSAEFQGAKQVAVNLIPQMVAMPFNQTAGISSVRVRGIHDGTWVSLRIEWDDATANTVPGLDQFEDMVAIQLPVNPGSTPNPMMGDPYNPVVILQWRAGRQATLDKGELPTVKHAYPNTYSDVDIATLVGGEAGNAYRGAASLGNPRALADLDASPIIAHKAKGYGTLTAYPGRHVEGKGTHDGSKWVAVFHIKLTGSEPLVPALQPGADTVISFAAWEGSRKETGGRKAWAPTWTSLSLAP